MSRTCHGFSLIEAMISVLVLSIGLLGLGQLQARLYLASRQDAERLYASLISSELYEKSASYALSMLVGELPAEARRRGPSSLYRITTLTTQNAQTLQTRITLHWPVDPDQNVSAGTPPAYPGNHTEIETTSLFNRTSRLFDTRWLSKRP